MNRYSEVEEWNCWKTACCIVNSTNYARVQKTAHQETTVMEHQQGEGFNREESSLGGLTVKVGIEDTERDMFNALDG